MRFTLVTLLPLAWAASVPSSKKIDYTGFKNVRITLPENDAQGAAAAIRKLASTVLHPSHKDDLEIIVSPQNLDAVKALASETTVVVDDVGAALAEEEVSKVYAVPSESWFTAYHSYNDHVQFLRDMQTSYPSQSEIVNLGTSVQGRPISSIHIWGSGGKGSKPAIVFHGTVHAREWISTMTTEYMVYQLLTKYSTDAAVKAIVDKFDFYITPLVNPDGKDEPKPMSFVYKACANQDVPGFAYTQTNDRFWRKNRQTVSGSTCVGRDINRNWPYNWGLTGGASTNPCDETFKGRAAGDAPELRAVKSQADSLSSGRGISFYVDFHSFGQYILWPYGHDCSLVAPEEAALRALATTTANGIRGVSGTAYTLGNSCRALYATTGTAPDYFLGAVKSKYAYTIELRPPPGNSVNGFALPANQIQPTVRETWAGVLAGLRGV
ncbi:hypothetical protein F66182_1086 [Fusarium sp. NRRL 66182]|nr:hypothetical protein F66182_1086 [Fusarium sp. NRRL 66182]